MNNELDGNQKLNVNISNILATEEELDQLKKLIVNKLGTNTTPPVSTLERFDSNGNYYEISFLVTKPIKIELIGEWLHSLKLIGHIYGELVH